MFFIASKVFWFLIRPETLLTLLVVGGAVLLFRRKIRWGRRCVSLAALAMVAIGVLPVHGIVLRPLEMSYPPDPAPGPVDGIIVLGGAEESAISAYWGQPSVNHAGERFLAALMLAHRLPDVPVIFTGGSGRLFGGGAEADLARALLAGAGLPEARLILEGRSRNTAENAALTFDLVPEAATGRWILVTSAFHMHRAVGTFCKAGWRNIVPWPVDFRTTGSKWMPMWALAPNLDALNIGLKEWVGVLAYRITGRLALPESTPGCLAEPAPEAEALAGAAVWPDVPARHPDNGS